jgi:hypothetical protein
VAAVFLFLHIIVVHFSGPCELGYFRVDGLGALYISAAFLSIHEGVFGIQGVEDRHEAWLTSPALAA